MEAKAIFEQLQGRFGEAVHEYTEGGGTRDPFCKVKPDSLPDVARFLRGEPELAFDFLQCVTAVDWIKQELIQVVYHLFSYSKHHSFVLKVDAPRADAVVPSVVSVWPTANWLEREQFDLLGVQFSGHPDLRRLLMPDDWDGHPMRKDWKEPAEYHGMSTRRHSTIELLPIYDKANPQVEGQRPVAPPAPAKAEKPAAAKPAAAKPAAEKPAVEAKPAEPKPIVAPAKPAEPKPIVAPAKPIVAEVKPAEPKPKPEPAEVAAQGGTPPAAGESKGGL